jgi:hypothetical protein
VAAVYAGIGLITAAIAAAFALSPIVDWECSTSPGQGGIARSQGVNIQFLWVVAPVLVHT